MLHSLLRNLIEPLRRRIGVPPALRREILRANHDLRGWGWCGVEKSLAMAALILRTRARHVVEIGVYGGRSLLPQALALAYAGRGTIVGVDPWTKLVASDAGDDAANRAWWADVDIAGAKQACLEAIARHGVGNAVELLECRSTEAWLRIAAGIDILHIDGGHAAAVASADAEAGYAKLAPGGHVWLDDVDWSGVGGARDFLAARCESLGVFENDDLGRYALYRKPPGAGAS